MEDQCLPRAPACSKACFSWLVLDLASADFCPALRDDGDDPYEVPEQLVQFCMFYSVTPSPTNLTTFLLDDFFNKSLSYIYMLAVWPCRLFLCLGPRWILSVWISGCFGNGLGVWPVCIASCLLLTGPEMEFALFPSSSYCMATKASALCGAPPSTPCCAWRLWFFDLPVCAPPPSLLLSVCLFVWVLRLFVSVLLRVVLSALRPCYCLLHWSERPHDIHVFL